jgi:hypothetical protein
MGLELTNLYRMPYFTVGGGISTEFGAWVPRGSKVMYVRSTGIQSQDEQAFARKILPSVQSALAQCRSGMDDVIFVLPGHVESISSADYFNGLVAGTKIVGLGEGNSRPTFTWTTATSTILLNVANVAIKNCILNLEPGAGTVTVAAPITVSAAGCQILGCRMRTSTDASNKTTIGVTTTAAADDFVFAGNTVIGATAGTCTTAVRIVGGTRLRMVDCFFSLATSAVGVGPVQFLTTAPTNCQIENCFFQNSLASSTAGFTGMAAATGQLNNCRASVLSGGNAAFATLGNLVTFNCEASNALGGGNTVSPPPQTLA